MVLAVISACTLNDGWLLILTAPLRYLGTISYGIYLWHSLVLFALRPVLLGDAPRACRWIVGLTLLLASLSWHFFEKPLMERFGRGASKSGGDRTKETEARPARPDLAHASAMHPSAGSISAAAGLSGIG